MRVLLTNPGYVCRTLDKKKTKTFDKMGTSSTPLTSIKIMHWFVIRQRFNHDYKSSYCVVIVGDMYKYKHVKSFKTSRKAALLG